MSRFPFDEEKTGYAWITSTVNNGYGHLNCYIRMAGLTRAWSSHESITIGISSQCSVSDWAIKNTEPFYGIEVEASCGGNGMRLEALERATKAMRKLHKDVDRINEIAGSPAILLEDIIVRTLRASKVEHIYCDYQVNRNRHIPDMDHYTQGDFERLSSTIRGLKHQTLEAIGFNRKAIAA